MLNEGIASVHDEKHCGMKLESTGKKHKIEPIGPKRKPETNGSLVLIIHSEHMLFPAGEKGGNKLLATAERDGWRDTRRPRIRIYGEARK